MNTFRAMIIGLATILLTGCLPEQRMVWSPDGGAAAVLSKDKLLLAMPDGNLTPITEGVSTVNWMPDSQRLIVVRKRDYTTWKDLAALLPAQRQQEISQAAAQLREQLLAYQGDLDKFRPDAAPQRPMDIPLMLLWLRDSGDGLKDKLGAKYDLIQKAKTEVFELSIVAPRASAKPGPALVTALACANPTASPDGRIIAYHGDAIDQPQAEPALLVVPAEGSGPARVVAPAVATFSGWSKDADGLYVTYVAAAPGSRKMQDALRLGTVSVCKVTDPTGKLLDASAMAPQDLAGVLFHEEAMAVPLADRQILFSSVEVDLPATSQDMPQQMSLFAVSPGHPTVSRMLPRQTLGKLGSATMYFAVSPDGQSVMVLGPKGGLNVVTLATGEVQPILPEAAAPPALPSWRSSTEICFVAPPGTPYNAGQRSEVVLVNLGAGRKPTVSGVVSAKWPTEIRQGFFDEQPVATRPAE